jgi:hypothetical protein
MTTKLRDGCLRSYDVALSAILDQANKVRDETKRARARLMELQAEALKLDATAQELDALYYRERCGLPGCECALAAVEVRP